MKVSGFRPVGREDVERRGLLAGLVRLLQWDGQRRAIKELLVLNGGTPEGLPHGNVLKRHCGGRDAEKREKGHVITKSDSLWSICSVCVCYQRD